MAGAAEAAIYGQVSTDLEAALVSLRPALLRHCYRMMGSFAEAEELVQDVLERAWKVRSTYRGEAPAQRWLYAIATNACIDALAQRRRRRELPQLESAPLADDSLLGEPEPEPERWLTPAADRTLFAAPDEALESRETVALAFVALLQRLPARQRAVLVLKDILDWSAEEIASTLGLSVSSVSSALHRARANVQRDSGATEEPSTETLSAFLRVWSRHDVDGLVALLRDDVTLAMPPWAAWFAGVSLAGRFLRSARFGAVWSRLTRVVPTRANGLPALAFFRTDAGVDVPHALLVARFRAERVAEMTVFIGAGNFAGFDFS